MNCPILPEPRATAPKTLSEDELATIETARAILRRHIRATDLLNSWPLLTDYLALNAITERIEVFRCLYLDRKNKLIRDKVMARGSVDQVPVYVSEVMRSALVLDASALILCHNHPSGDPTPSKSDLDMTRRIVAAARTLDITVHDHVIVGFGGEQNAISLRTSGAVDF